MNWKLLRKSTLNRVELDPSIQNANLALDRLLTEFEAAESATKSLYLAVKKLPDHVLCTGKFEVKLTDELASSNLFSQDESTRCIIEDWHSFASQSSTIGDEYVITLQKTLIDPIKRLKKAFAELRAAIKIHDSKQLDLIRCQKKVSSYVDKEKTGANLVKLEESKKMLSSAQNNFARSTQVLLNDLSKFITGSVEMLKPLLEAFIAAEVSWVKACKNSLDSKSQMINTIQQISPTERSKTIENSMRRLGSLSICTDSK